MAKILFLVDSHALAYRSFYAFINNPLKTSAGAPTSALFGYVNQVLRILRTEHPTHFAIVKDPGGKTFRHDLFAEYKAQRKPMPDDLRTQLPVIEEFLEASGLPLLWAPGYEADDVMATVALRAAAEGWQVRLVTRDKDMGQIVSSAISLYEPGMKGLGPELRGPAQVLEKFGVPPERMVDLLALMGDASDNIPGVEKVGPKTAVALVTEFGSVEEIYAHLDRVAKPALRDNLEKHREAAFLSKRLATLDTAAPVDVPMDALVSRPPDHDRVEAFLRKWELTSLLPLLGARPAPVTGTGAPPGNLTPGKTLSLMEATAPSTELNRQEADATVTPEKVGDYRWVRNAVDFNVLVKELEAAREIAVDTETTGLDPVTAELVGLCLSTRPETGWYVPVAHADGPNVGLEELRSRLRPLFAEAGRMLVFHHAKYDLPVLERAGLLPEGGIPPERLAETMIAAHLLTEGERGVSLDELALRLFGHSMIPIESLIGKKGPAQKNFREAPVEEAGRYGAEDADYTLRLWKKFAPEIEAKGLTRAYREVELPLVPVLMRMEAAGVRIDGDKMKILSADMGGDLVLLEKKIHASAGEEFNIASPKQLAHILFEVKGLAQGKKTKTGFSTDIEVLEKLRGADPIIDHLIEYRELTKLRNTYVDVLPDMVNPGTGRLHTSYSQTIAATGRLSSVKPNLQNIPIRSAHGKLIRECFVAGDEDHLLLSADYSQIELRVLAHLSGDPGLLAAFRFGEDIHARTAAALFGAGDGKVTSDMRRSAKVVNFGVIYGMGARRLAAELGIPMAQASEFIGKYFTAYAGVKQWKEGIVAAAREKGYVETMSGRRRYLSDLLSGNRGLRENAERMAGNTPVQGSAADLMKLAMIAIHRDLPSSGLDCRMLLQVHDELVFEVAVKDVDAARAFVRERMEKAADLMVPLVVDVGVGKNWLAAHG